MNSELAAELEAQWRERLVRFCDGYLRRREEAEDVAAEVIVAALTSAEPPRDLPAWLLRSARNRCLNRLRDGAVRMHEPVAGDESWIESATGPATAAERGDEAQRAARLLERLSAHERELLRLRYQEELSRSEIAAVVDLPERIVKSRLFEALQKLR